MQGEFYGLMIIGCQCQVRHIFPFWESICQRRWNPNRKWLNELEAMRRAWVRRRCYWLLPTYLHESEMHLTAASNSALPTNSVFIPLIGYFLLDLSRTFFFLNCNKTQERRFFWFKGQLLTTNDHCAFTQRSRSSQKNTAQQARKKPI